jgi:MbtH protein
MRSAKASSHEIIVSHDHVYVVWPAGRALPAGWRYLGKGGSEADLQLYLREMFVETMPAPMLVAEGRAATESRWG